MYGNQFGLMQYSYIFVFFILPFTFGMQDKKKSIAKAQTVVHRVGIDNSFEHFRLGMVG